MSDYGKTPFVDKRRLKKHYLFDAHYDAYLACSICEVYQSGPQDDNELLNEVIALTAPLIGLVARHQIGFQSCDFDVVRGDALEELFFILRGQCVPTTTPRRFTAFLYTIIYRAMINSIRKGSANIYDYWLTCDESISARLPTHEDIDYKVYYQQLRDIIRRIAISEIRFDGNDREVCKYIIDCILGYNNLDPNSAQFKFKITKTKSSKLSQYCNILVKRITYEIKELDSEDS